MKFRGEFLFNLSLGLPFPTVIVTASIRDSNHAPYRIESIESRAGLLFLDFNDGRTTDFCCTLCHSSDYISRND